MATSCRGTDEARGGGGGAAPPTCDVCRRSSVNDAVVVLLVMYAGVGRSVAPGVRAGQGEGGGEGGKGVDLFLLQLSSLRNGFPVCVITAIGSDSNHRAKYRLSKTVRPLNNRSDHHHRVHVISIAPLLIIKAGSKRFTKKKTQENTMFFLEPMKDEISQ